MTAFSETADQRLYRDADRAVLGGVCAGLAGYFGLNLKVTRLLAIIAFFMAMPFAVVAYLAVVFLVPAESSRQQSQRYVETGCCWGVRRSKRAARRRARRESDGGGRVQPTAPEPSIRDVRQRYQSLDRRLAELEKEVTSPRFQLEQEFRKL